MNMQNQRQYFDFYNSDDPRRWSRADMSAEFEATRSWLSRLELTSPAALIVEIGCGSGAMQEVHPGYVGLDFSLLALQGFKSGARRLNGDMQHLPLRNGCVDFLFSWAALEHVPQPEYALEEVARVLKPGGAALLAPAWHCRTWAAKGLPVRPYRELPWPDKIAKATIPLRNTLVWRSFSVMPRRVWREWRRLRGEALSFDYRRLSPNLTEHIYTDCDAFSALDPHAVVLYYLTRGWQVLSHPGFGSRFLARNEPVVVRKPRAG